MSEKILRSDPQTQKYKEPILFRVDINHPCWFCDVTERNRDATLKAFSIVSIDNDYITNLIELTSPEPDRDIGYIRKHRLVKNVEILMKKPNGALLKVTSSYKSMTYKILHQTNALLLESPITKDGVDSEILMVPSQKDLNALVSLWREQEGYDIKLKMKKHFVGDENFTLETFHTSGFLDLKTAKDLITPKQMEAFQLACKLGYYDSPKKVDIERLSQELGISAPTYAEHLRKAEARLLPILLKVLAKM